MEMFRYNVRPVFLMVYNHNVPLHVLQGFGCKAESGRLTLAAVALQDHITHKISVRYNPQNLHVSDASCPAAGGAAHVSRRNKTHSSSQTQGKVEREYVLDPAPPRLTLGRL